MKKRPAKAKAKPIPTPSTARSVSKANAPESESKVGPVNAMSPPAQQGPAPQQQQAMPKL